MKPRRIWADFHLYSRSYLRSPEAIFFSLIFPFFLILMFGALYSGGGTPSAVPLYVQNMDHNSNVSESFLSDLNRTGLVNVAMVSPDVSLQGYLTSHSQSNGLILPDGFGANVTQGRPSTITVITNPYDQGAAGLVQSAVGYAMSVVNQRGAPPLVYESTDYVGVRSYSTIDYVVPGLIGLSIITSPMFSMVTLTAEYKKEKLFKQLSLTPLTKSEWLASKIMWNWVVVAASAVILIATGDVVFHAAFLVSPYLLVFLLIGPLFFVSLGMLVGTLSKKAETAGFIGNLITFPMMFLSGAFIPVSIMPGWLQPYARIWPLYYFINGITDASVFNNPGGTWTDILITLVMAAVTFAAAVVLFRWRED